MTADDIAPTPSPRRRSRITKGSKLLPSVHEQSVWARIMRDTLDAMVAHCGGEGRISEPERLQARRIAALEAELIHIEDRMARHRQAGEEPPPTIVDLYTRLANGQRRHCEALGWERTPRDITPDVATYSRQRASSKAEEDESLMLNASLHPKVKPNQRHWYAYDVAVDGELVVTDSRDPEHDLALGSASQGHQGQGDAA